MRRPIRHLIAIAASSTAAVASLTLGLIIGKFAVDHGVPNGFATAVTVAMVGVVTLPTYIAKKLLVDYW